MKKVGYPLASSFQYFVLKCQNYIKQYYIYFSIQFSIVSIYIQYFSDVKHVLIQSKFIFVFLALKDLIQFLFENDSENNYLQKSTFKSRKKIAEYHLQCKMKQIRSLSNHHSISQNYNGFSSPINSVQVRPVHFNLQQNESSFITQPEDATFPKKSAHNQVQKTYLRTLEQTVCNETFSNVQNIINQNLRTIQALNDQNQRLYKHLDNLKSLFAAKFNLSYQTQTNRITVNIMQNQSNLDSKGDVLDKKIQKLQKQGIKKQAIRKSQVKVKTQHRENVERILSESNKGTMNYQNQGWKTQHSFVMFFLTNELKSKVRPTQDITKTIDKRALRKKYLSWKEENGFQNIDQLPQFKIGQILTNEIKALFHCTCSSKDYLGLQFIDAGENVLTYEEETFLEGQSSK